LPKTGHRQDSPAIAAHRRQAEKHNQALPLPLKSEKPGIIRAFGYRWVAGGDGGIRHSLHLLNEKTLSINTL